MSYSGDDTWLAEAPGLDTTGMHWSEGDTQALGYYGGHRMNHNSDWGNAYTCGFRCDIWGIDSGLEPNVMGEHVKDAPRSQYYDNVVQISGETYYEVDFSTWEGASGKSLYVPYATAPWDAGDIFVWIENSVIDGNKSEIDFSSFSGTDNTFEITAQDNWTAVSSENWVSLSSYSGTSGTSGVDVSVTANQSQSGRTATVTFSCSGQTFDLTVNQSGIIGVTGDTSAIVFRASGGSNTQLTVTADMNWTATSSENWLTVSPSAGTIGSSAITITADQYTGTTSARTASVTFSSSVNTFVVSVTQKKVSTFGGIILGELEAQAMYLGDVEVEALYLGDLEIAAGGPPNFRITPSAFTCHQSGAQFNLRVSSPTDWTIDVGGVNWVQTSVSGGTSGTTNVMVTVFTYGGDSSRNTTLTVMTTDSASSATCVVTQTYIDSLMVPHLVNFNAKQYDPQTNTIPNSLTASLQYDLELTGTPDAYDASSITVSNCWGFYSAEDAANNPFNSPQYLTIIAKTDNYAGGYVSNSCLVANRYETYNWMVKQLSDGFFLHTAFNDYTTLPRVTCNTQPNIWAIVVGPNMGAEVGYGKSYTDNVTGTVQNVQWGGDSSSVGFLKGQGGFGSFEAWEGRLFWLFISNSYLSGSDIQAVIDYNENL